MLIQIILEMDRNLWTLILVIAGSCLVVGSAYIQYKDKKESDYEAKTSKREVREANEKIIGLNEEIKTKTIELLDANKKISVLSDETLKIALGNGYIEIELQRVTPDEYEFVLQNNSNYPIYDVSVEFLDFDEIIKCPNGIFDDQLHISRECAQKNTTRIENINFIPQTEKYSKPRFKFINGFKHFLIKIHSRNSTTLRQCVFKVKSDGLWEQSYRLYEFKNSELKKVNENNKIGIPKTYWNKHFFKEIIFNLDGFQ